jgi:hypothetical protein
MNVERQMKNNVENHLKSFIGSLRSKEAIIAYERLIITI